MDGIAVYLQCAWTVAAVSSRLVRNFILVDFCTLYETTE